MATEDQRASQEVVYRAVLAPGKAFAEMTIDDFRRFVRDCDAQGISGDTKIQRDRSYDLYGLNADTDIIAERKVSLRHPVFDSGCGGCAGGGGGASGNVEYR